MAQDFWALALFLAPIFHGGTHKGGALETQGPPFIFIQINLTTRPYSFLRVLENAFSCDTSGTPLPLETILELIRKKNSRILMGPCALLYLQYLVQNK